MSDTSILFNRLVQLEFVISRLLSRVDDPGVYDDLLKGFKGPLVVFRANEDATLAGRQDDGTGKNELEIENDNENGDEDDDGNEEQNQNRNQNEEQGDRESQARKTFPPLSMPVEQPQQPYHDGNAESLSTLHLGLMIEPELIIARADSMEHVVTPTTPSFDMTFDPMQMEPVDPGIK